MKSNLNRTIIGFGLASLLVFTGCGSSPSSTDGSGGTTTSAAAATTTTVGSGGAGALAINSFTPAGGTYATMPSQIQVTFNETIVNTYSVETLSNWSMSCTSGATFYATSASQSSSNPALVNLSFSNNTQQVIGSTCTLNVSAGLYDNNGVSLGETISSAYTTASGAAALPGVTYSPQSTATYIYAPYPYRIGGPGGNSFSTQAPISGYTIQGFQMATNPTVSQFQAVWGPSYGTSVSGPSNIEGGVYGSVGGTPNLIMCPSVGNSRVIGIYGYAGYNSGQYIDELGAICQAQDGSSSTPTYTNAAGTTDNGSYYSLTCPAGTFVTSFGGSSGNELDSISWLGCQ